VLTVQLPQAHLSFWIFARVPVRAVRRARASAATLPPRPPPFGLYSRQQQQKQLDWIGSWPQPAFFFPPSLSLGVHNKNMAMGEEGDLHELFEVPQPRVWGV